MAKTSLKVIGGKGIPWKQVAERSIALDDTIVPGAIQPYELKSDQNIFRPPGAPPGLTGGEPRNLFGYTWVLQKHPLLFIFFGRELGINPRFWSGGGGSIGTLENPVIIDGDEASAISMGSGNVWEFWTFDLGVPVPVNRIRFFPPPYGIDPDGKPYKDDISVAYEVSVTATPNGWLLFEDEQQYHPLENILERTLNNTQRVVDLRFPLQVVRFLRLYFGLMLQRYTLAEVEVYGEGFVPKTQYRSQVLDFETQVNFGRIFYRFTKWRKMPGRYPVEAPEAPVELTLTTKSGLDETPLIYHIYGELGKQKEVPKEVWERAITGAVAVGEMQTRPSDFPGSRGAVTEDVEWWDPWSTAYRESGEEIVSSDGRRYLQVKFELESKDVWSFGRLDSLAIEYSPLLVKRVIGELSLLGNPAPPGGVIELLAGVDTVFAYDVRAEFDAPAQRGFDTLVLELPVVGRFVRLEMGEPLREVEPERVVREGQRLVVGLPERVTRERNVPLRVIFRVAVVRSGTVVGGLVVDSGSEDLPQSIDPGDVTPAVTTDDVRVFTTGEVLDVLPVVEVEPRILTGNGDGWNDRVRIRYTIVGIEGVPVGVEVVDIRGRRVWWALKRVVGAGRYVEEWDGQDGWGRVVRPGVYLCRVWVETATRTFQKVITLAVVY